MRDIRMGMINSCSPLEWILKKNFGNICFAQVKFPDFCQAQQNSLTFPGFQELQVCWPPCATFNESFGFLCVWNQHKAPSATFHLNKPMNYFSVTRMILIFHNKWIKPIFLNVSKVTQEQLLSWINWYVVAVTKPSTQINYINLIIYNIIFIDY